MTEESDHDFETSLRADFQRRHPEKLSKVRGELAFRSVSGSRLSVTKVLRQLRRRAPHKPRV